MIRIFHTLLATAHITYLVTCEEASVDLTQCNFMLNPSIPESEVPIGYNFYDWNPLGQKDYFIFKDSKTGKYSS